MVQMINRGISSAGNVVRVPVGAPAESVLAEPSNGETGISVEVTLLGHEDLVQDLIDPRKRRPDGHF